jgi:hypothetical protein
MDLVLYIICVLTPVTFEVVLQMWKHNFSVWTSVSVPRHCLQKYIKCSRKGNVLLSLCPHTFLLKVAADICRLDWKMFGGFHFCRQQLIVITICMNLKSNNNTKHIVYIIYIHIYIQSVNTTTSDRSNMQDTATCFGLVNGPSSGCSQNLWGDYTLGVVYIYIYII